MQCLQQRRRHLALLFNCLDHALQSVPQFAQVSQPRLDLAKLDIVQSVGRLLAVTRDEGHTGATVEQINRSLYLFVPNPDFLRDLRDDFLHPPCQPFRACLSATPSSGLWANGSVGLRASMMSSMRVCTLAMALGWL